MNYPDPTYIPTPAQRAADDAAAFTIAELLGRSLVLCEAFTPAGTGPDTGELVIPFEGDGVTPITWNVNNVTLRVGTAGGAPSISIEKSTGSGIFTPTAITSVTLASGAYEGSVTGSLGTVQSGDKLRFNVLSLGTASSWTVIVGATPQLN